MAAHPEPTTTARVSAAFRAQIVATLVLGVILPPLGIVALIRMRRSADRLPSTTGWLIARYAARLEALITVIVVLRLALVVMNAEIG